MKTIVCLVIFLNYLYAGSYASLLYYGNCVTCHQIKSAKSAPSIIEVQLAYKNAFKNKETFVEYMSTWVLEPNEEGSLMHDAIEKYGLMPQLAYDKDVLKDIAVFIYETDFNSYTH